MILVILTIERADVSVDMGVWCTRLKKLLEDLVDGYLFDSLCCCELSKISDIQDISSLASCNCFSGFYEICAYNHYCDVV